MELEAVLGVSVGGVTLQVGGKVDDGYGFKGTFLDTNSTSNTQLLRDGGNPEMENGLMWNSRLEHTASILVIGGHFNAQFSHSDHRTGFLALLSASLGLALVGGHDGDPGELVRLLLGLVLPLGRHLVPAQLVGCGYQTLLLLLQT